MVAHHIARRPFLRSAGLKGAGLRRSGLSSTGLRSAARAAFLTLAASAALPAHGSGRAAAQTPPEPGAPAPADQTRPGEQDRAGEPEVAPLSVLILGGTGFLGPHVVEEARARGHTVTIFHRGKTRPDLFDGTDVEVLHGDRDGDLRALEGRRWDAVVDTSGYVPRIVKDSAELLAPNVGQYVFISTISVFGDTSRPGMDESGPLASLPDETSEDVEQHYGALKALCEQAAEAAMPGRVTVIRPGLIAGPGDPTDRFTYWPVRFAGGGEVLAPGDGGDAVQYIDARDLAAFIVRCMERRQMGTFNATGPAQRLEMGTLIEACAAAAAAAATEARVTWVERPFLEEQQVAPWSDMPVWIPAVEGYEGFAAIDCSRAIEAGLRFRPLDETVRDTLDWWQTLPETRRAKLRAGLSPEREAEVLAAWHARPPGPHPPAPDPAAPEPAEPEPAEPDAADPDAAAPDPAEPDAPGHGAGG